MLSFWCPINLNLKSKGYFSIFCSSQIALAHPPVHVRMTSTILF